MTKSMTGFGRGLYEDEYRTITCDIRSVNHRYSEISVKLPRRLSFAEDAVKAMIKNAISRGKTEVFINMDSSSSSDSSVKLDIDLAGEYMQKFKLLSQAFPELSDKADMRLLVSMPDVMKLAPAENDEEMLLQMLAEAVSKALDDFDSMRTAEGEKLAADIVYRNGLIEEKVLEIEKYAPEVARQYMTRIKDRITELTEGCIEIPQDRILLEAAVFADKSNITEEIVRLKSHCGQLRSIISSNEPIGKKLDFLVQEMNREANTIGSKANDVNITNNVLFLKAEIEKIREQIQNLE